MAERATVATMPESIAIAKDCLGVDPLHCRFTDLTAAVDRAATSTRRSLLGACKRDLSRRRYRLSENLRIGIIRVAVALMPDTTSLIMYWLERHQGTLDLEIHFTLFCYLDQVARTRRHTETRRSVRRQIRSYLMNIRSNKAHAAWMAGHLLGDHWRTDEATPVLLEVAERARFSAGRKGALHGIERLLNKATPTLRRRVMRVLGRVAAHDRNERVRDYATMVMEAEPARSTRRSQRAG